MLDIIPHLDGKLLRILHKHIYLCLVLVLLNETKEVKENKDVNYQTYNVKIFQNQQLTFFVVQNSWFDMEYMICKIFSLINCYFQSDKTYILAVLCCVVAPTFCCNILIAIRILMLECHCRNKRQLVQRTNMIILDNFSKISET